jgi:hypothetical protein
MEKKLRENEERHHLALGMMQAKHEKQMQALRFSQFLGKEVAGVTVEVGS